MNRFVFCVCLLVVIRLICILHTCTHTHTLVPRSLPLLLIVGGCCWCCCWMVVLVSFCLLKITTRHRISCVHVCSSQSRTCFSYIRTHNIRLLIFCCRFRWFSFNSFFFCATKAAIFSLTDSFFHFCSNQRARARPRVCMFAVLYISSHDKTILFSISLSIRKYLQSKIMVLLRIHIAPCIHATADAYAFANAARTHTHVFSFSPCTAAKRI